MVTTFLFANCPLWPLVAGLSGDPLPSSKETPSPLPPEVAESCIFYFGPLCKIGSAGMEGTQGKMENAWSKALTIVFFFLYFRCPSTVKLTSF